MYDLFDSVCVCRIPRGFFNWYVDSSRQKEIRDTKLVGNLIKTVLINGQAAFNCNCKLYLFLALPLIK